MQYRSLLLFFLALIPFRNVDGQDLNNLRNQKPVDLSGGFELRGIFYNSSGIPNRRAPFTYFLSGSPTLSIYGWNIPFSFSLSKDNRSFQQPFNQFGLSPTYKWMTLHVGYRNVNFSQFSLAGHTMLGAGFEINPGRLRAGFMYGRLNKATVLDTTTQTLQPFSFSRRGMAGKLGFGTQQSFFDLNFLHAKDDSTSRVGIALPDAKKVLAASNTVIGYGARLQILKGFVFDSEAAVSLYTHDMNSPLQVDSSDNFFVNKISKLTRFNGSSEAYLAFQAGLAYKAKNYGLKLNYRRIEPNFQTMGAYYFSSDIQNLTINPSLILANGRFRMNVQLGIQNDNVLNQKETKSSRFIGSGTIGGEITDRLGIDASYSNFSNNQKVSTLKFADSLKIVQTTQSISVMPRYSILGKDIGHFVFLSLNLSGMKDYNSYFGQGAASRDMKTQQYMLNYTLSLPLKSLSIQTGLNHTSMRASGMENTYSGVNLGGNYRFAKNRITAGINTSYMLGRTGNSGKSTIINGALNLDFQLNSWQSIRGMLFYTNNNPGSFVTGMQPNFTETRGELAYQIRF